MFFFFNDTATTEIYTLSLHDALPICLLHLSPDMSHFAEAIQDFRTQCDREVARNRATREHVQQLEQQYDATAGEEQQALPSGELDSDKLMQELQDFLRGQRERGEEG